MMMKSERRNSSFVVRKISSLSLSSKFSLSLSLSCSERERRESILLLTCEM